MSSSRRLRRKKLEFLPPLHKIIYFAFIGQKFCFFQGLDKTWKIKTIKNVKLTYSLKIVFIIKMLLLLVHKKLLLILVLLTTIDAKLIQKYWEIFVFLEKNENHKFNPTFLHSVTDITIL